MLNFARLKEALGDGRTTYASKAMSWLGEALILNRKRVGMPGDFWDDQEDRAVLKGSEVDDPNFQRLQVRTDDFRRYLTYGVGRFMPYAVPVIAAPLLIAGILAVMAVVPRQPSDRDERPGAEVSAAQVTNKAATSMTDIEIAQAIRRMNSEGKTVKTINDEERAILNEAQRRGL